MAATRAHAGRDNGPEQPPTLEIVDALPTAVTLTRFPDGFILYANLATIGLLRASGPEEVVGRPISRFIDSADLERYEDYVRHTRRGAQRRDNRFGIHRLDDSMAVVEVFPMTFQHRGDQTLMSVLIDVTERVEAERALAAAEERYRMLIEMAPEGFGVQIDGRYVLVNAELVRMLGAKSESDLIGMPVIEVVAPEERERVAGLLRNTPSGGPGWTRVRCRMLGRDGRTFMAEVSSRRIQFDGQSAGQAIIHELSTEEPAG